MRIPVSRIVSILVLLSACSSGQPDAQLLQPDIALYQAPMSQFLLQYPGPISVGFQMEVRNPSSEPITLRRLELTTMGTGSYYLRRLPLIFNKVIAPNDAGVVSFSASAYAQGGRLGSIEPVTVRGIAYFDSPAGKFHRIFTQHIRPTAGE